MLNKMNTGAKGVGLVILASAITMGVAVLIIVFAIMFLIDTTNCGAMSRALPVLWGAIAAVFLISVLVIGCVAWKIISNPAGRLVIMAVYGAMMLASFVVIALGLLIAFNC